MKLHTYWSLSELSKLFDNIIDNVKEECGLDRPAEDRMRVMVTSNALISSISTRIARFLGIPNCRC